MELLKQLSWQDSFVLDIMESQFKVIDMKNLVKLIRAL